MSTCFFEQLWINSRHKVRRKIIFKAVSTMSFCYRFVHFRTVEYVMDSLTFFLWHHSWSKKVPLEIETEKDYFWALFGDYFQWLRKRASINVFTSWSLYITMIGLIFTMKIEVGGAITWSLNSLYIKCYSNMFLNIEQTA